MEQNFTIQTIHFKYDDERNNIMIYVYISYTYVYIPLGQSLY